MKDTGNQLDSRFQASFVREQVGRCLFVCLFFHFRSDRRLVKFGEFYMQQNVQMNATNNDVVTFGGQLTTKDSYGGGTVNASMRRIVSSDSHFEVRRRFCQPKRKNRCFTRAVV